MYNSAILLNPNQKPYNFDESLRPLFDAMISHRTIKSVTCFAGIDNKDDHSKDFKIENFEATEYHVAALSLDEEGKTCLDHVRTNKQTDKGKEGKFYMNCVRAFEL